MTKLNPERPYLKYIDNLHREMKRAGPQLTLNAPTSKNFWPGKSFRDKMDRITLRPIEYEHIRSIISLLSEETELFTQWITFKTPKRNGTSIPGRSMGEIEKRRTEIRTSIIDISMKLILMDLEQSAAGREKGVFDWFNIFGAYLYKFDADESWDYLKDCFGRAVEQIVSVASEALKSGLISIDQ